MFAAFGCLVLFSLTGCNKNPIASVVDSLKPETPREVVRQTFNPFDPDKRRHGLAALAASDFGGDELYVRTYRTLITDRDATVRAVAVQALGLHGTADGALKVIPLLEGPSDIVRWEAAKALQKLHHKDAIVPLSKSMRAENETEADVRQACAAAMGQYATEYAFEALVNALNDNDFGVVAAARDSLATLTGHNLGSNPSRWITWADEHKDNLFAEKREYTWTPFERRPSLIQRMQFWKEREKQEPRKPAGLDDGPSSDAQSKS